MIESAADLDTFLTFVRNAPRVAIDTEADSLHCYREKLCLVQVELPNLEGPRLIDPLMGYTLAPFYEALREKPLVLHGADYDLRLFKRSADFVPHSLFDTMIAARLLGRREFSLAALVRNEFGVEMPKGSQKANWARRPLTEQMLAYARNDTRYLFALSDRLGAELQAKGRWVWFAQSCQRLLDAVATTEGEKNREESWRLAGSGTLRGRAAALLRELWWWRDAEAALADRPPFHVLRNEEMLSIAKAIDAGEKLPSWRHVKGARLRRLEIAVQKAMDLAPSEWPARPRGKFARSTAEMEAQVNALKQKRDLAAQELDLDPSLIAARATLEGIAYRAEAPESLLMPWQRELLGV